VDSKAECVQLNFAHIAKKEETKNKRQCPISFVQVQDQ